MNSVIDNFVELFVSFVIDMLIDLIDGIAAVVVGIATTVISFCLFAGVSAIIVSSLMLLTL